LNIHYSFPRHRRVCPAAGRNRSLAQLWCSVRRLAQWREELQPYFKLMVEASSLLAFMRRSDDIEFFHSCRAPRILQIGKQRLRRLRLLDAAALP
jgi:hypothetical protein